MHILECHPMDQLFSHEDMTNVTRHFNTSAMGRAVVNGTVKPEYHTMDLYEDLVDSVEQYHGVEQDHIDKVVETIDHPILLVRFTDGSNLIVDGNHRIVKRWRMGLKTVVAAIFNPGQWEQFLVTDVHIPRTLYAPAKPEPKGDSN